MSFQWFIRKNGVKLGPISERDLKQLARNGDLKPEEHIRREDREKWCLAGNVKGLFSPVPPKSDQPQKSGSSGTHSTNAAPKSRAQNAVAAKPSTARQNPSRSPQTIPQKTGSSTAAKAASAAVTDDFLDSLIPDINTVQPQPTAQKSTTQKPTGPKSPAPRPVAPRPPAAPSALVSSSAPPASDNIWDDLLPPGGTASGTSSGQAFSGGGDFGGSSGGTFQPRFKQSSYRGNSGFSFSSDFFKDNIKTLGSVLLTVLVILGITARLLRPVIRHYRRSQAEQITVAPGGSNLQINTEDGVHFISQQQIQLPANYPGVSHFSDAEKSVRANRLDEAIRHYTQAIQVNSKFTHAYNGRGLAYYHQKKYQAAISDFNKAIELDSKSATAYNNRGLAYSDSGNKDMALRDYQRALELDPKFTTAYSNRAMLYVEEEEYEKALVDLNKALQLDRNFVLALHNRAFVYLEQERFEDAVKGFDETIRIDPRFASAYAHRGLAYLHLDEDRKALADFEQALRLNPKDTDVRELRDMTQTMIQEQSRPQPMFSSLVEEEEEEAPTFRSFSSGPPSRPTGPTGAPGRTIGPPPMPRPVFRQH